LKGWDLTVDLTDKQFDEIMKRAGIIKEKQVLKKRMISEGVLAIACIALMILTAFYIPQVDVIQEARTEVRYGSLLLGSPHMGYVIIGILAFVLGILVALLCINWREKNKKERE